MNYLYKITNIINNKIYVGVHQTDSIDDRYMGSGTAIIRAIKKYGIENFRKDILEFFDTYEMALEAEELIVDKKFILREDVYNLRTGGIGGWGHINSIDKADRINIKSFKAKIASGELKVGGSQHWTEENRKKVIDTARKNANKVTGAAHTESANNKRNATFKRIGFSQGKKNSQYGKFWISNIETKEVRRTDKGANIPDGWVRGKKGHEVKTAWINNGIRETIILIGDKDYSLNNGYIAGRLRRNSAI